MSARGRFLREFVYARLKAAIDAEAVMQLQSELMCAGWNTLSSDEDIGEVTRRARRLLRQAWRRYGEEVARVTTEVGEAALPPPG